MSSSSKKFEVQSRRGPRGAREYAVVGPYGSPASYVDGQKYQVDGRWVDAEEAATLECSRRNRA